MKKLRRALGSLGSVRSAAEEDSTRIDLGRHSTVIPRKFSPLISTGSLPKLNETTYVSYDTYSIESNTPSCNYVDPIRTSDPLFTKLHKWAYLGNLSKVKKFLIKIDINAEDTDRRTPLHLGAAGGNLETIAFLLNSCGNLEAEDRDGRTPFLRAVEKQRIQAVQLLLHYKVNINAKDNYGNTALHIAATLNHKDLLELLLEVGLDYEMQNIRGQTPIHAAAANLDINAVKCLLSNDANPNVCDKEGVTPLMISTKQGCKPLAQTLIAAGSDIKQVDCSGWNASFYARCCGYMDLGKWLDNLMRDEGSVKSPKSDDHKQKFDKSRELEDDLHKQKRDGTQDNSWNDDSSSSLSKNTKFNLSKFAAISNDSLSSVSSFESKKYRPSSGKPDGPPKPPRLHGSNSDLQDDIDGSSKPSALNKICQSEDNFGDGVLMHSSLIEDIEGEYIANKSDSGDTLSCKEISFSDDSNHLLEISESFNTFPKSRSKMKSIQSRENLFIEIDRVESKENENVPDSTIRSPHSSENHNNSSKESVSLQDKETKRENSNCDNDLSVKESVVSSNIKNSLTKAMPKSSVTASNDTSNKSTPKLHDENINELTAVSDQSINSYVIPFNDGHSYISNVSLEDDKNDMLSLRMKKLDMSHGATLGRIDTLHHVEEIWEANASLHTTDVMNSKSSSDINSENGESDLQGNFPSLPRRSFGDSKESVAIEEENIELKSDSNRHMINTDIKVQESYEISNKNTSSKELSTTEVAYAGQLSSDDQHLKSELEKFTTRNLKYPLDVEEIHDVLQEFRLCLKEERSLNQDYIAKLKLSFENEKALKNEIAEHKKVLKICHHKMANLSIENEKLKNHSLEIKSDLDFASSASNEDRNEVPHLEIENKKLKTEVEQKSHHLSSIEENLKQNQKITEMLEEKLGTRVIEGFMEDFKFGIESSEESAVSEQKLYHSKLLPENRVSETNKIVHNAMEGNQLNKVSNIADVNSTRVETCRNYSDGFTQTVGNFGIQFKNKLSDHCHTDSSSVLSNTDNLLSSSCQETQTGFLTLQKEVQTDSWLLINGLKLKSVDKHTQTLSDVLVSKSTQISLDFENSLRDSPKDHAISPIKQFGDDIQDPELFSKSIQSEISYGGPHHDVTFINKLNDTMDKYLLASFDKIEEINRVFVNSLSVKNESLLKAHEESINKNLFLLQDSLSEKINLINATENKENSSLVLQLKSFKSQLNNLDEINQELKSAREIGTQTKHEIMTVLEQLQGNALSLENINENTSQCLNKYSEISAQNDTDIKPDLLYFSKSVDDKQNDIVLNLNSLKSNMEILSQNIKILNEKTISTQNDIENNTQLLLEKLYIKEDIIGDMLSKKKESDEKYLNEITLSIEQAMKESETILYQNFKTSLGNLDTTVAENFEVLQNLMINIKSDLTIKVNEMIIDKIPKWQESGQILDDLSTEVKTINSSLASLKSLIESYAVQSAKSDLDANTLTSIWDRNTSNFNEINEHIKHILKRTENCENELRRTADNTLKLNSQIIEDNIRIKAENQLLTQREKFDNEIHDLTIKNSISAEQLKGMELQLIEAREKNGKLETRLTNIKFENQSFKDIKQHKPGPGDENYNLDGLMGNKSCTKFLNYDLKVSHDVQNYESTDSNCNEDINTDIVVNSSNNLKLVKQENLKSDDSFKRTESLFSEAEDFMCIISQLKFKLESKERQLQNLKIKLLQKEIDIKDKVEDNLEEQYMKQIRIFKSDKSTVEKDLKVKMKEISNLQEIITDLKHKNTDHESELNLKSFKIGELKEENVLLQKRVKTFNRNFEYQNELQETVDKLLKKAKSSEEELQNKESFIANLKERIDYVSGENTKLMKEIRFREEKDILSIISPKYEDESEKVIKEMKMEFDKMRETLINEFVSKSSFVNMLEEMKAYLETLFSKKLQDYNNHLLTDISHMKELNATLKERQTYLEAEFGKCKNEITGLESKISTLNSDIDFWKSKYNELRHGQALSNRSNIDMKSKLLKEGKIRKLEDKNLLEEIKEHLKTPYPKSLFLESAKNNIFHTEANKVNKPHTGYNPATKNQSSKNANQHIAAYSIDDNFNKHFHSKQDTEIIKSKAESSQFSRSVNQDLNRSLQDSFESYVNFLKKI